MRAGLSICLGVLAVTVLVAAGAALATSVARPAAPSGTAGTTTLAGGLPGPPTLTSAVAGVNGVDLAWHAPNSDGGSAISGYRVYRGTASGIEAFLATVGNVTAYTDATTVKGVAYVYEVTAVNAIGEGARSNELAVSAIGPRNQALFDPYQVLPSGSAPEAVAVGDVTGDGRDDVVMTTGSNNDPAHDFRVFVFAQAPDGTLSAPVSYPTNGSYTSRPTSVAIGDITGDGRADVVVGLAALGIQVFPQTTDGTLGSPTFTATGNAGKIRLGRLNGDTKLDVAGVGWGTNTVSVLLNNGLGGLSAPVQYSVQHDGYEDFEIADVTNDTRDDLVVMSGQGLVPNVSVVPQLAGGGFGSAAPYGIGGNVLTHGIGVGDVTGDGRNDVVASYGGNSPAYVAVFAQIAGPSLASPVSYPSYEFPAPVDVRDLDGDGRADVLAVHSASVGVYRQTANGLLGSEDLYPIPASEHNPHGLAIGDVNGDGVPDVAIASARNGLVVLRNTSPPAGATLPGPPTVTGATAQTGRVQLDWSPPAANGGSPITGYRIYRGTTASGETFLATVGTYTTFVDTRVTGGITYYYRVAALNAVGESPPSNELSATPAAATQPDPPTGVTAQTGYNRVSLAWKAPTSDGGASITGYNVYRGTTSGGETFLTSVGGYANAYTDFGAVGGTTYYYVIRTFNSVGESGPSEEVQATPLTPAMPDAPHLTAATPGVSRVTLNWDAPTSNGGAEITAYKVYRGSAAGAETLLTTLGKVNAYADTSGTPGATYYYQVTAANSVGESVRSNELSGTPIFPLFQPYDALPVGSWPEAVAVGDVTGDGRADVVMTTGAYFDPENDYHLFVFAQAPNGTLQPPVSYPTSGSSAARPTSVAVGDITGDGKADVVVGLDRVGVEVFPQLPSGLLGTPTFTGTVDSTRVRVGHLNDDSRLDVVGVGWGTGTVAVLLNDGSGRLSAPSTYSAPHGGYDDLELGDVTGDGRDDIVVMSGQGYAVPDVSVLAQLAGGGFGAAATYNVPGSQSVTSGIGVGDVTGDGRKDVVASLGEGGTISAAYVFAQTSSGTLAAPVSYAGTPWPGPVELGDFDRDGRVDVASANGDYQSAGLWLQKADGTLDAEQVYALPYATRYNPHGMAVGDVNGDGAPDLVIADYNDGLVVLRNTAGALPPPPPTAPGAPALKPPTAGAGGVTLTWTAPPSNGGAQITGYKIYRGSTSGGEALLTSVGAVTTFTDASATGATFFYEVAAVNSAGEGPRSNERLARMSAATVPGAPVLNTAVAGKGSVALGWSEPSSDGGSAIVGYDVYRGTTSGGETLLATLGNLTSFTDTSAQNGITYFYKVAAVNSIGEGTRSNERSATPATVPGAPTLTTATAGNASVALAWSAPTSNGGSAITGYRIYRGAASAAEVPLTTLGSVTSFTDTTAANGTTYYYEVAALNFAGEGAVSNELSATPAVPDAIPPSKPSSLKLVIAGTNQLALDWPASVDNVGVVGYRLYRNNVLVATVAQTAYLDSGLAAATTYTYAVRAVDAAGNTSAASGNLSAKTLAASTSTTGTLGGAVYDTNGQPLANAVVSVAVGGSTKRVKTNAAGAWKIGNVPPATYAPNVSLSGYQAQTLSITAVKGKTVLAATFLTRS